MIKTKKEKDVEFSTLDKMQQDGYLALRENNTGHEMAMRLARRYKLYDIERILAMAVKMKIPVYRAFTFNVDLENLTTEERKLYFQIVDKFATEPGDEYLAMLMVNDYDMANLQEIVNEHKKGSLTIDVFAEEQVRGRCRFKIVTVDPEPEEEFVYAETSLDEPEDFDWGADGPPF